MSSSGVVFNRIIHCRSSSMFQALAPALLCDAGEFQPIIACALNIFVSVCLGVLNCTRVRLNRCQWCTAPSFVSVVCFLIASTPLDKNER